MEGKSKDDTKDQDEQKPTKRVPVLNDSVIKYYSKYRNNKDKIKSFLVSGSRFDIEEKYEIIDCGELYHNLSHL